MKSHTRIFLFCTLIFLSGGKLLSKNLPLPLSALGNEEQTNDSTKYPQGKSRGTLEHIIRQIQDAVNGGDVRLFSGHFAKQIFVSLGENENGYFSANQATLVLQDYFSSKRNVKFNFSTSDLNSETPYATGGGTYFLRGTIRHFQIYISFVFADGRWVITQFNVY